jgi:hypothetical protein
MSNNTACFGPKLFKTSKGKIMHSALHRDVMPNITGSDNALSANKPLHGDECPRCGQRKVLPLIHDETPTEEDLLKIRSGELLWSIASMHTNPYRFFANRKCVQCELEWRE